jgi:hypothetical protein
MGGEPDGEGKETLPNGDSFAGEFLNGKRHGKGRLETARWAPSPPRTFHSEAAGPSLGPGDTESKCARILEAPAHRVVPESHKQSNRCTDEHMAMHVPIATRHPGKGAHGQTSWDKDKCAHSLETLNIYEFLSLVQRGGL